MIKEDNYKANQDYLGYTVTWAKDKDNNSFTYAVGGRGGCKCSGVHVSQLSKDVNIRVVPTTSYFHESANIVIAIPPKETAIADMVTAFIGMLDSYKPTEETSFDEYMKSAVKIADDILSDASKYDAFLQLPKYEFFEMYPSIPRVVYSLLIMELHGNLRELNRKGIKDER